MISEETYNNQIENSYLTSNKVNYNWLIESKDQLDSKQNFIEKNILKKKLKPTNKLTKKFYLFLIPCLMKW